MADEMKPRLKECGCKAWKEYGDLIWQAQAIASTRSYVDPFPPEGVFIYCPWCGKKREDKP